MNLPRKTYIDESRLPSPKILHDLVRLTSLYRARILIEHKVIYPQLAFSNESLNSHSSDFSQITSNPSQWHHGYTLIGPLGARVAHWLSIVSILEVMWGSKSSIEDCEKPREKSLRLDLWASASLRYDYQHRSSYFSFLRNILRGKYSTYRKLNKWFSWKMRFARCGRCVLD